MIDIWGSAGMPEGANPVRPPPDLQGAGEHPADLSQNDVDIVIVNDGFASGPGLPDERRFALSRTPLDVSPAAAEELAFVEAGPELAPPDAAVPNERPALRLDAFAEIDALDRAREAEALHLNAVG